jgi:hypothetical protein
MAKESAEEKLLKMMKRPASSVAVKPSLSAPLKKKFKFTFSVGLLNIFLFLAIIVCFIFLVIELLSGSTLLNQAVQFPRESKADVGLSDIALPSTPSVDYYLKKINERNIFKPYVPKPVKPATVIDLAQQMSKYKLVGIAWLDLPDTASIMINDTANNKILFLKKGEQLEGGITIKTIFTDRAVFSHDNEETTIKL